MTYSQEVEECKTKPQAHKDAGLSQYAGFAEPLALSRVEVLIAAGANVNFIARNYKGDPMGSNLDAAVSRGLPEMVQLLLDKGAKIVNDGNFINGYTTVMNACYHAARAE